MIDEHSCELLSRHLDGDLDACETAQLRERLAREPALRAELESLGALRSALRRRAEDMVPPIKLDALMEPLRRAQPRPRGVRRAYPYLAAAAVMLLALTLGIEVTRRGGDGAVHNDVRARRQQAPRADTEVFRLRPLPTARAEEAELVGASDHLLAQPPPDPPLEEPQALHIIGPLEEEDQETFAGEHRVPLQEEPAPREELVEKAPAKGQLRTRETPPVNGVTKKETSRVAGMDSRLQSAGAAMAPSGSGKVTAGLVVEIDGMDVVCGPCSELPQGRGTLWVSAAGGTVMACRADTEATPWSALACRALTGVQVPTLADGLHRAIVTVDRGDDEH